MSYVVDASVVLKWFHGKEPLEDRALALLRAHGGDLEAPDFLLIEVANVSWRKVRLGEMPIDVAPAIIADTRDFIARFHAGDALLERALELALTLDHPVYDCLYLACAETTGRILITDDQRLAGAVRGTPHEHRVETLAEVQFPDPTDDFY